MRFGIVCSLPWNLGWDVKETNRGGRLTDWRTHGSGRTVVGVRDGRWGSWRCCGRSKYSSWLFKPELGSESESETVSISIGSKFHEWGNEHHEVMSSCLENRHSGDLQSMRTAWKHDISYIEYKVPLWKGCGRHGFPRACFFRKLINNR